MKVENVKIYDLEESLNASGYSKRVDTAKNPGLEKNLERGHKLSKAADWQGGHDQFLTGINVSFDITMSIKMSVEFERYKYLSFVSSQSTMFRITSFDLKEQCNSYVDRRIIDIVQEKINEYKRLASLENPTENTAKKLNELYLEILYNIPTGFELTARITTNYRCLKNVWRQRRFHRLPEWRDFCKWIESLPYAKELMCFEKEN